MPCITKLQVLLFLCVLLVHHSYQDESPRVLTQLGPVVGSSRVTETGKKIYSFTGIPYIKPPVGGLRFRPPQPAEPWTEDFAANRDSIMCIQKLMGPVMGSEDCVVINVFTPQIKISSSLSVMVFIHGGGFIAGSSPSLFGMPDYLLEHDVLVVSMNYRLGILGFLSTEDEEAPGNYGLLDQVEALKWVKNNILVFGGNPNDVTIFGESAGSASVHMHLLSPMSKGLFHRAILQSGVSICPWATTLKSNEMATILARKVGCQSSSSAEMIECLRKVDDKELIGTEVIDESQTHGIMPITWSPRIDSESGNPFLPEHPINLMTAGNYKDVPVLVGHTSLEGGIFMSYPKVIRDILKSDIENKWDNTCKLHMGFREFLVSEAKGSEWCSAVKQHYIDSNKSFEDNLMNYATAIGDTWIVAPIYKATELMSRHTELYSYVFAYDSKTTSFISWMLAALGESEKVEGNVAHADDLLYIFKLPHTGWTKSSPEYKMIEMMTKIWTDFAKTGVPPIPSSNESWPKASWPNHKYVIIDTHPSIEENYQRENMQFVDSIYSNTLYKSYKNTRDEL